MFQFCWQCSPITFLPFGPFIQSNPSHSPKHFFKPCVTLEHPAWGSSGVRHPDLLMFCQPYQFTSIEGAWKGTQITTSNGCLMACKWAVWSQPEPAYAWNSGWKLFITVKCEVEGTFLQIPHHASNFTTQHQSYTDIRPLSFMLKL